MRCHTVLNVSENKKVLIVTSTRLGGGKQSICIKQRLPKHMIKYDKDFNSSILPYTALLNKLHFSRSAYISE